MLLLKVNITLGEIKISLSKLPPDMDDLEIIFIDLDKKGKYTYELICFTGYMESVPCIALGSEKAVKQFLKNKKDK